MPGTGRENQSTERKKEAEQKLYRGNRSKYRKGDEEEEGTYFACAVSAEM
jgi:hypothetical protein